MADLNKSIVEHIVNNLKSGKLKRSYDEKYYGGFYDMAISIVEVVEIENKCEVPEQMYFELVDQIYSALYLIAEVCLNKDFN